MRKVFVMCLIAVGVRGIAGAAELQVNVRTSDAQTNAAVATSATGGSVIAWSSYYTTAGRSNDILARRLDAKGGFLGDEFHVNVATAGNQTEPAVAMHASGRFAVVWQGPGPDQEDVFLRLFRPNGDALTSELLVNLATAGRQLYPSVAAGGPGTFVVAWESRETVSGEDKTVVRVQLFDPNGSGLGGQVLADTDIYDCRYPEVAMDGAGRFAVTWMRDRSNHPIVMRLFDANGVPVTDPLTVNTASVASITRPSIAMNSRGCFVVAWDGHPSRASEDDIYVRCYDPLGVPRGEPLVVNTIRTGAQQWPQATVNDANEFIVVWQHDTGDPNAATEVAGRYFDRNGLPVGEQFQLNTTTPYQHRYPDVAMVNDGSFIAAWEANRQDGSNYDIFAVLAPSLRPVEPNQVN